MQATNVKLSAAEMALACNSELLLTKNRIIEKVYELFGELAETYRSATKNSNLPPEILSATPKISRGENYLGLPWVVLDYPRYFKGEDFFSIRTFFWWGHYFSMAFLVKGKWLELIDLENVTTNAFEKEWLISTVLDPWQHHISQENTILINELNANAIQDFITKNGFLKLQVKIEIKDWDEVQNFMEQAFKFFFETTNNQY